MAIFHQRSVLKAPVKRVPPPTLAQHTPQEARCILRFVNRIIALALLLFAISLPGCSTESCAPTEVLQSELSPNGKYLAEAVLQTCTRPLGSDAYYVEIYRLPRVDRRFWLESPRSIPAMVNHAKNLQIAWNSESVLHVSCPDCVLTGIDVGRRETSWGDVSIHYSDVPTPERPGR